MLSSKKPELLDQMCVTDNAADYRYVSNGVLTVDNMDDTLEFGYTDVSLRLTIEIK